MVIGAFNNIFAVAEENQRSFSGYWQLLSPLSCNEYTKPRVVFELAT